MGTKLPNSKRKNKKEYSQSLKALIYNWWNSPWISFEAAYSKMSCQSPGVRLAVKMCSAQAMRDLSEPGGKSYCHQGHETLEFKVRFQKDGFWIASNALEKKRERGKNTWEKWIYFLLDKQYPSLQQILCKEPWCRIPLKEIDLPADKWSLWGIFLRFLNELGEFANSPSAPPSLTELPSCMDHTSP